MCAAVTMRADVNNKRLGRYLDLVGAEEEQHVDLACGHLRRIEPTGAGHEAQVERSHTRGGVMQNREAVPVILQCAKLDRRFGGKRGNRRAVLPRKSARAEEDERSFRRLQRVSKRSEERRVGKERR